MKRGLCLLFLLGCTGMAAAELVVVTNARNGVESLSRNEVINIFMGRYRHLPGGLAALPADLPASHPAKARFYRLLVDKDLADIDAYWARLVFSGKTSPPRPLENANQLLDWIIRTTGAVAYLDRKQVDGRVRVVLALEP